MSKIFKIIFYEFLLKVIEILRDSKNFKLEIVYNNTGSSSTSS